VRALATTSVDRFRRELHAHPEPGWAEFRTTARLIEELALLQHARVVYGSALGLGERRLGVEPEQQREFARRAVEAGCPADLIAELADAGPGVVCEFGDGSRGGWLVLRFDIDALAVRESDDPAHAPVAQGFASGIDGYSHACGHDGHAAIGLGVARRVDRLVGQLPLGLGVRIIFQPAEEGTRGAAALVDAGWLRGAGWFFGLHLDALEGLPAGTVVPGTRRILATEKLDVVLTGRASHAAESPELGRDALAAAVDVYAALRGRDWDGATVSCNALAGGEARNVIAAHAELKCEIRAVEWAAVVRARERFTRIVEEESARRGVIARVDTVGRSIGGGSDGPGTSLMRESAERAGLPVVDVRDFGASDDAADLMAATQRGGGIGSYGLLATGGLADAHSARFDCSPAALESGVALMTECVRTVIREMRQE
jgi:aminobenzoyl-glutamate utilization protein A